MMVQQQQQHSNQNDTDKGKGDEGKNMGGSSVNSGNSTMGSEHCKRKHPQFDPVKNTGGDIGGCYGGWFTG